MATDRTAETRRMAPAQELTHHAQQRMRQRGLRDPDIQLVLECGTQAPHGRVMLRDRDVDREITECKRRIQRLEKLRRVVVVCEDSSVVTCYHAHGPAGRRTLRGDNGRRGRRGGASSRNVPRHPDDWNVAGPALGARR